MKRLFVLLFLLPVPAWSQPAPPPSETGTEFGSPCPYPDAAKNAHAEGATLVSYRGTRDGHFTDVAVVRSSGNAYLDAASVQCVSRWRFDPDGPTASFRRGDHQTNIDWKLSGFPPGEPPAGVLIGRPHTCSAYYPKAEGEAGTEGVTTLSFTITDEGRVEDIAVAKSSGNANLDNAAVLCARPWRYLPALEAGKPVAVPWKAKVVWKIEGPRIPPLAGPAPDCLRAYPVKAEDLAGIDGVTEVSFVIAAGEVRDVTVKYSSGNAALDRAAVECVASRHYQRDTMIGPDGTLVDKWRSMTVRTRIDWHDALPADK